MNQGWLGLAIIGIFMGSDQNLYVIISITTAAGVGELINAPRPNVIILVYIANSGLPPV